MAVDIDLTRLAHGEDLEQRVAVDVVREYARLPLLAALLGELRDADELVGVERRVVGAQLLEADRAVGQLAAEQRVRVAHVGHHQQVALHQRDHRRGGATVDRLLRVVQEVALRRGLEGCAAPLVPAHDRLPDCLVRGAEGALHRILRRARELGWLLEEPRLEGLGARLCRQPAVVAAMPVEHAPHAGALVAPGNEARVLVLLLGVGAAATYMA